MLYDTIELSVCDVCINLIANGEYNDGTDAAKKAGAGIESKWGDQARHFVLGGEDFGHCMSDCDACGQTDHGDRYSAVALLPVICHYCTQVATHITRESGEPICLTDAKDQYEDWRHAVSKYTERTRKMYQRVS